VEEDEDSVDSKEMDMGFNFQKTYGWYLIVNRVTGNDFTKHEVVYQKKIMEVLNQLSFLLDYDREQIKLQKKQTKTI
jgi:hypothetical protein